MERWPGARGTFLAHNQTIVQTIIEAGRRFDILPEKHTRFVLKTSSHPVLLLQLLKEVDRFLKAVPGQNIPISRTINLLTQSLRWSYTSRDSPLSSLSLSLRRHQAVSSVCRPQTWQEQHPAAQTGHPAHHDHEPDVVHRRQVGDNAHSFSCLLAGGKTTDAAPARNFLRVSAAFPHGIKRPL